MTLKILLIFLAAIIIGCGRLDANLHNASVVENYEFDNYAGETDFKIDDPSHKIFSQYIHDLQEEIFSDDGVHGKVPVRSYFIGQKERIGEDDYTVILYCHGNRDHMDFYWPRTKLLANVGGNMHFGVLTLDYRGYGATEGPASEDGMYADVAAAIQWLKTAGLKSENFVIYGFSMGTAPATELTANPRIEDFAPSKIILESPFASAEVMVQDSALLALPASYFTNLKIDNAEEIKKLTNVPLLWIHGEDDDFLDIETHGSVVYKNHPGIEGVDKFGYRVVGGTHSNLPEAFGSIPFEDYKTTILDFIENR